MSFWSELRRRNVVKVGAAYLVVAWLLLQIADVVLPTFNAPPWVLQSITFLLMLLFPIVLIIAWAFEITPEGIKKTASVPREASITHVTSQVLNYVITGLVVLVVAFVVLDQYVFKEAASASQENQRQVLPNSVAVLPFDNLSPDPDNAYFAAGIHDEILNQLVKLKNLNVIARTSVMQYANAARPIQEIARELNVETVMEGSVSYADGRVAVRAQLIDANTGVHIWSESYNRKFADIFGIQADIAMNIANALEAEFSGEEQQRIERPPTDSAIAYALYLQANNLTGVGEQAARMHELLDQAISLDPNFALAWGAKAWLYANSLINTTVSSAQSLAEVEPRVRECAEKALKIDSETRNALEALAEVASLSWNWSEAREAYDRVYELASFSVGEPTWFRVWSGDEAEALEIAERQVAVDPQSWGSHWTQGMVLNYMGDHEAAVAKFRDAIALGPTFSLLHSWLAMSEVALGNEGKARQELELAEQLLGENRSIISLLDVAYGYGRIGDSENARRLFNEISKAANRGQDIGAGGWALLSLAVGNVDDALDWLKRGADKASQHELDVGYYSLMNIKMNYTDDPVLKQPEFVDVRNRLRGD